VREGDIAKGAPVTPAIGRLTFDDAVATVLDDYRQSGKASLEDVRRRVNLHLNSYFGGQRMASINTPTIRSYVTARLDAGAKPASVNRELAILKRAFRLALQDGRLIAMPHVPMLQERNARAGFFEREQFEDLRSHLPDVLRGVVTFAYLTGWRIPSEVLTLTWSQVDFNAGIVRLDVGSTKNDEGRSFPFDVLLELTGTLESQRAYTDSCQKARNRIIQLVFHRNGKPIKSFYSAWRAACTASGLPGRIPHDFRRSAVRNLVRAGVPEKTAMLLTGHKTRSVFDRYDIVNESDLREAATRLATSFSGKAEDAATG
jgi:integrase